MKGWPLRLTSALGVIALVVVLVAVAARGPLLRSVVAFGGQSLGYHIRYGELRGSFGHAQVVRPEVRSLGGEPVLEAATIDVTYDPREFFSTRRLYGISSLELDRPKVTIIHHRDGTYNIDLPQSGGAQPAKPFTIPQLRFVVRDGSVGLIDETRIFAHSRRLAAGKIQVDADLDPARRSIFTFALAVLEEGGKYPVAGRGTFEETRGYELARIRARTIALAPLMDYALNSTSLHVAGGVLNDVDARSYGLRDRSGAMQRHLSVTANLDHFQPYLNGLAKPLRDGRGALRVYDDGLTIPKVDGSIAGVPVRIAGAIYNFSKPRLRLGISGKGDLSRLVSLNEAAKTLPLAGPVAFRLLVEGDAAQPMTLAGFSSTGIRYARFPIDAPHGLVALHGLDTTILRSGLSYDGIAATARGNLRVQKKHTLVDVLAGIVAPAARLPYAAGVLGPMLLRGDALVNGVDANLAAAGAVSGESPSESVAGTFDVDARGVGTVGPFRLEGPGSRRLYARVALDRPHAGGGVAYVSAVGLHVSTLGPQPELPGIDLARLPPVEGNVDVDAAGALESKHYSAAGSAHAYGVRAYGFPIDDVTARAQVGDGGAVAVDGRYRGSLATLASAAGGRIAAGGRADVPFSVVLGGATTFAQIHDARFEDAQIAGVPLEGLEATLGLRGKAAQVYAARVRLGGNDVVAQGSFGDGGTLDVSAGNVALAPLRALGLPVRSGNVTALAAIGGTLASPVVAGGVAADDVVLANAELTGLAVSANTGLTFRGDDLALEDALVRAGPAVGALDGTLSGLRANPRTARYAFDAHVRQADIATLAHILRSPLRYPAGTLDADVRVAGSGAQPSLDGKLVIPEGSLNGLRFRDASVPFSGTPAGIRARGAGSSSAIRGSTSTPPRARARRAWHCARTVSNFRISTITSIAATRSAVTAAPG